MSKDFKNGRKKKEQEKIRIKERAKGGLWPMVCAGTWGLTMGIPRPMPALRAETSIPTSYALPPMLKQPTSGSLLN